MASRSRAKHTFILPYSLRQGYRDCDGFAVVKDDDGRLMGCHATEAEAQDQVLALNISESEKALLATRSVKATQEEVDERYDDFQDAVNMSASEIEQWGQTECADEASERPGQVRERVVSLLRTPKDEWGDAEYEQAGRVVSFISRMRGVEQGEPAREGCPSDRDISLMNWGYDPTKNASAMSGRLKASTLVYPGKAVHDVDDKGRFGGYLVRFGDEEKTDLEGDFFTKDTNFFLRGGQGDTLVFYGHGWDPDLGTREVTAERARLTLKDAGVWMEMQMQARDEYEEMIMELARMGNLGLSSGTAAHLVSTEQKGSVSFIKTWPLGVDGSLTPQPAEPRNLITPLKSYAKTLRSLKSIARDVLGVDKDERVIQQIDTCIKRLESSSPAGDDSDGARDAAVIRDMDSLINKLSNA